MSVIDLAGIWRLRCDARGIDVDYPVPGDVHSALIAASVIPQRSLVTPKPYKFLNLPKPGLTTDATVVGGALSRSITFTPDNPAYLTRAKDTLLIRDLYSSSH